MPHDRRNAARQQPHPPSAAQERQEHSAPRAPQAPKDPINVLVIGPTQNGKSTIINSFLNLSTTPARSRAREGNLSTSCTLDCDVYEVDVPTTSWGLVDPSSAFDIQVPEDEHTIFSQYARRRNMALAPQDPQSPTVRLRLIDTPGLDDSRGCDLMNIQTVLQQLAKHAEHPDPTMRHVNVVVFVVSMNTPFSNTFQGFYDYYKKCMPNLFGGVAIINTNFTMDMWKAKAQAQAHNYKAKASAHLSSLGVTSGGTAKDKTMKQRRTDFAHLFHCDPRHFFIDSVPAERFPFEQLTTRNTMTEIVHHFMAQGPMPIESMRFPKFRHMEFIDMQLAQFLNTIKGDWSKDQNKLLAAAGKDAKLRTYLAREGREIDADIAELEKDLKRWDTEEEFKLNTHNTHDPATPDQVWKFCTFRGVRDAVVIPAPVAPFYVTTTNSDSARWTGKTYDADRNEWTCRYKANWASTPKMMAQSWTLNRTMYAEQITQNRRQLRHREAARLDNERMRAILDESEVGGDSSPSADPNIKSLGELMSQCDTLIRSLKASELSLIEGVSAEAARRYAKTLAQIGLEDLMDMLRVWNPNFAHAALTVARKPELAKAFAA